MAKPTIADEVHVLRFFESGPIEKATAVFNIVADKMRERLQEPKSDHGGMTSASSPKKRRSPANQEAHGIESAEPSPTA